MDAGPGSSKERSCNYNRISTAVDSDFIMLTRRYIRP